MDARTRAMKATGTALALAPSESPKVLSAPTAPTGTASESSSVDEDDEAVLVAFLVPVVTLPPVATSLDNYRSVDVPRVVKMKHKLGGDGRRGGRRRGGGLQRSGDGSVQAAVVVTLGNGYLSGWFSMQCRE